MLKNRDMLGSELRDKIELYSELTGQDGWNAPIAKVADFMSGFEMGREKFRKRGHWIPQYDKDGSPTYEEVYSAVYECSICGGMGFGSDYCPNCGEKMEE